MLVIFASDKGRLVFRLWGWCFSLLLPLRPWTRPFRSSFLSCGGCICSSSSLSAPFPSAAEGRKDSRRLFRDSSRSNCFFFAFRVCLHWAHQVSACHAYAINVNKRSPNHSNGVPRNDIASPGERTQTSLDKRPDTHSSLCAAPPTFAQAN